MIDKVVLSIVSHGQGELVREFLASFDEYALFSDEIDLTIIITENLSSSEELCSLRGKIKYIHNLRPKGFGSNHNAAFESSLCDFFFVVNPDVTFCRDFDFDCFLHSLKDHRFGVASPAIVGRNGTFEDYRRKNLTPLNLFKRIFKFDKVDSDFDWFAGVFLCFRSDLYKKLNGFDPKFFMYVEDCDICLRSKALGYKLNDLVSFEVCHEAQRGSHRSSFLFFQHLKSLFRFWLNV